MAKTDKSNPKTVFVCQQCGKESFKWLGRCPACQQWNTFVEKTVVTVSARPLSPANPPQELSQVALETSLRLSLPMNELNRVLGGGLVPGS
ncbi:MAG: radA, partial [Dehalococcoidales bacterium]|nr:radA [Dehalococcoidales bacterium]